MGQSPTLSSRQIHRIVVGVDFTRTGDDALREAMLIARGFLASELHVTHVISSREDVHDADEIDQLSTELQVKLTELRERVQYVCAPAPDAPPFTQELVFHVRLGSPAHALHQVAIDVDADMLVVGTHGRRGVEKLLLGSVAEELLRIAQLPLMIAHPKSIDGLRRSDRPEPARPGEDLHSGSLTHRVRIELTPRTSHISGLL